MTWASVRVIASGRLAGARCRRGRGCAARSPLKHERGGTAEPGNFAFMARPDQRRTAGQGEITHLPLDHRPKTMPGGVDRRQSNRARRDARDDHPQSAANPHNLRGRACAAAHRLLQPDSGEARADGGPSAVAPEITQGRPAGTEQFPASVLPAPATWAIGIDEIWPNSPAIPLCPRAAAHWQNAGSHTFSNRNQNCILNSVHARRSLRRSRRSHHFPSSRAAHLGWTIFLMSNSGHFKLEQRSSAASPGPLFPADDADTLDRFARSFAASAACSR